MAQSPEEMIQSFLEDPDALNKLGDILGAAGSNNEQPKADNQSPFDNPEIFFKITKVLGALSDSDDNETRLIEALKPYLSEKRSESADKAIKFMKLSKMAPLFGDLNIF